MTQTVRNSSVLVVSGTCSTSCTVYTSRYVPDRECSVLVPSTLVLDPGRSSSDRHRLQHTRSQPCPVRECSPRTPAGGRGDGGGTEGGGRGGFE